MTKAVVAWSGGKDSCMACYVAMQQGYEILSLVNTISDDYQRVRFHGITSKLVQDQARSVGLPLLQFPTSSTDYEGDFKAGVDQVDADAMVFGDIHLEHCRSWAEGVCGELGFEAVEPLWGKGSEAVLRSFIEAGFEACIVSCQADLLDESFLGRCLDLGFVEEAKQRGIDPCGENGEFHTLVVDGPLFKRKIEILKTEKILKNGFWFLDIQKYQLVDYCSLRKLN